MAEQEGAPPQPEAPAAPKAKETPAEVLGRLGEKKDLENVSEDEIKAIVKEYYDRMVAMEGDLFDINYETKKRDLLIDELNMEVSDMRGRFVIPKLKKVHTFKLTEGEE